MAIKQGTALAIGTMMALVVGPGTADASTVTRTEGAPTITMRAPKTITLTVADNGRRVAVHEGENVLIRLRVDPRSSPDPTTWWRAVDESGRALKALPQTAISIRGVTRGRYRAVAPGEATLSSSRAVCPRHSTGPTCHSMQGWHVTIEVVGTGYPA